MTADLQLAETGAPAPTISAEEPPTQGRHPAAGEDGDEHADVRARKIYALTVIPVISFLLALLVGALLIILSSPASQESVRPSAPAQGLRGPA